MSETRDIREFARLYRECSEGRPKAKLPKAMDDAFANPQSDAEAEIKQKRMGRNRVRIADNQNAVAGATPSDVTSTAAPMYRPL